MTGMTGMICKRSGAETRSEAGKSCATDTAIPSQARTGQEAKPEGRAPFTARVASASLCLCVCIFLIMFLGGNCTAAEKAGGLGPSPCAPLGVMPSTLPDPKSAEAVGWMVLTVAGLVAVAAGIIACAVGVKSLRAKPVEVPLPPQPFITEQTKIYVQEPHFRSELGRVEGEMGALKMDVHQQLKEFRAYVHTEMHSQTNQNQVLLTAMNLQKDQLSDGIGEVHDRVTGVLETVTRTEAIRAGNGERLVEISAETTENGKQIARLSGLIEQLVRRKS